MKHVVVPMLASLLTGCAMLPKQPGDAQSSPAGATAPGGAASASIAAVLPALPRDQQQAQKLALAAAELLQQGSEEAAIAELHRALALDSQNVLAHKLQRQITADPVATLGRESFTVVVRPGESLSILAQRYLNDIYSFYILARYNEIKVPRQVAAGQVVRIPGKTPPPEPPRPLAPPRVEAKPGPVAAPVPAAPPPPEPSPADEAFARAQAFERSGDRVRAYGEYQRAANTGHPGAPPRAEQLRLQLVQQHTRRAREAFAKQDLDSAIREWDNVLVYESANSTAQAEKKRAQDLKKRADQLPQR